MTKTVCSSESCCEAFSTRMHFLKIITKWGIMDKMNCYVVDKRTFWILLISWNGSQSRSTLTDIMLVVRLPLDCNEQFLFAQKMDMTIYSSRL